MPPPLVLFTAKASGPPDPWPGFAGPTTCLDFDGGATNEGVSKNTNVDLNFANAWSIEAWAKMNSFGGSQYLVQISRVGNQSRLQFFPIVSSGNKIRMQLYDSAGTNFLQLDYDHNGTALSTGVWYHIVFTWDGSTCRGYFNATQDASPDGGPPSAGTMANDTRRISHGSNNGVAAFFYDGRIYSVAIWNVTLSAAAITKLYNGGNARNRDLAQDSGSYTSSANLQHWWLYGRTAVPPESNMGINYGLLGPAPNVMDNAANIDAATDLVTDHPA